MAVVKGSKQIKMVVVPHRPMRAILFGLVSVLVIAGFSAGAYFYGFDQGVNENILVREERDQLLDEVSRYRVEVDTLQQQLVNAQQSSAVDRQALVEVQGVLVNLQDLNAQLQEDVLFYRQIMSPENQESGLVIGQVDLSATEEENRIRYHIELKQLANNDNVITGYANVNILGKQNGQEVSLPLHTLALNENQKDIRLQFRYFQNIEGEMLVPEDFAPENIQIVAVNQGNDRKTVQKNFVWLVESDL